MSRNYYRKLSASIITRKMWELQRYWRIQKQGLSCHMTLVWFEQGQFFFFSTYIIYTVKKVPLKKYTNWPYCYISKSEKYTYINYIYQFRNIKNILFLIQKGLNDNFKIMYLKTLFSYFSNCFITFFDFSSLDCNLFKSYFYIAKNCIL